MSSAKTLAKSQTTASLAKPFLKWVGGKSQLREQFSSLYPTQLKTGEVNKYFELFTGGGAIFFDVIQKFDLNQIFLNDINQDLILAYRVIQRHPWKLIAELVTLKEKLLQLDIELRAELFYQIRRDYNQQRINFNYQKLSIEAIKRVAWLIFINKTCFNGLYRTNKKGDFNAPFGRYKNPKICDQDNLLRVSDLLQGVTLVSGSYRSLDKFIDRHSFIYIDPPYRPITKTANFTAYAKSRFNDVSQVELSSYYKHLGEDYGAKVMLSNSNPHNSDPVDNFFHDLYRNYRINEVYATRMINSDASKRGKITELVITNY